MNKRGNEDKIVNALIVCKSDKEVAELLGVANETICRWKKDPKIMELYNKAIEDTLKSTLRDTKKSLQCGVDFLKATIENEEEPTANRIQATKTLFNIMFRLNEVVNVEERLTELERVIGLKL